MQKKVIEDYIADNLSGEDQKIALDFAAYLRELGMTFEKDEGYWKNKIYYLVKYSGKCVCFIAIKDPDEKENRWTVWSDDMDDSCLGDIPPDEEIKAAAWRHVDTCGNCGSCGGGKPRKIFGKEFKCVCGCTFRVDNPGSEDLAFMKKMAEIKRREIEDKFAG